MADGDLPSIDEEFAQLNVELARVAAMPLRTREQQNSLLVMLESLRDGWREKGRAQSNAPEWRRLVDDSIAAAFDSVLGELRATIGNRDGKPQLDSAMLNRHLRPVLDAVADGLRRNLVQKFGKPQPPGTPPAQVDAADVAGILLTLFGPTKKK